MLKKQLDLLRQQQDCFGRNWLLPFNEKNQYDVTQTMKACRQMQSPFDLNLLCQEVGGPVRLFPDQVNLYKFTMKLKDMKKEKIEEKVNEYSIDQKFAGQAHEIDNHILLNQELDHEVDALLQVLRHNLRTIGTPLDG